MTSSTRASYARLLLAGTLVSGAAATALLTPAYAGTAPVPGTYTTTLDRSSVVAGAAPSVFTVTVANASPPSSEDVLNSGQVAVAAGFVEVSAPSVVTDSSGLTWTVSTSGNTVTFSSPVGLAPGATVSVPVTAGAPTKTGTYTWGSSASGVVNSVTGTSFTNTGNSLSITVLPSQPAQLAFTQQPSTTQVNTVMTPAVAVAVEDAYGNLTPAYTGTVTLSAAFNPNTGDATDPPGLPVSATPASGTATFSDLAIGEVGNGYTLQATSGSLTPATSTPFDVPEDILYCPAGQQCDTGVVGDPSNTTADIVDGIGSSNDVLDVSVGNSIAPTCGSGSEQGLPVRFDNTDSSRLLQVTQVLAKSIVDALPDNGTAHYNICYASTKEFTTASGAPATSGSNGEFDGLLPDCGAVANLAPCVASQTKTQDGDVKTVYLSPGGDPQGIYLAL